MPSEIATNTIIRNFIIQDLTQILAIENQVAHEPWDKEIFIICAQFYYFIVAVLDNVVIGYGIIVIHANIFEAHILKLAVDPLCHQQGIGSKLMNYLIDLCVENFHNQSYQIFLEVNTLNTPAILLYKKFNFINLYIRKNYYNTANGLQDAVVMLYTKV